MKVLTAVEVLAEGWLVSTIGETEEADHLGDRKAGEGCWTQVQKSYGLRILVLPPICSKLWTSCCPRLGLSFPIFNRKVLARCS